MRRPPPDDDPGPQRMTPRRHAAQVEAFALEVGALALRGRKPAAFTDDLRPGRACEALHRLSLDLADLATAILVGVVPLAPETRDDHAGRGARPLLDAIEGKGDVIAESLPACGTETLPDDHPLMSQNADFEPDEPAPPARCPDCGGLLDQPYGARKANSKKACHLGPDGKARSMKVPPEEVRRKREHPPAVAAVVAPRPTRTYEAVYTATDLSTRVETTVEAADAKEARDLVERWRAEHRPNLSGWRFEVRPVERAKAERRAKKMAKADRALASELERDARRAQFAVECSAPGVPATEDDEPESEEVA